MGVPDSHALTQEDEDTEQDGDECSCAEPCRGEEGLRLADRYSEAPSAWTHSQCQGAGAAELRLPSVPHHHSQLVQLLLGLTETPPSRDDAGAAVCQRERVSYS